MKFRHVKWKRNLNKIPKAIRDSLAKIKADLLVVSVTKQINKADIGSEYAHIFFPTEINAVATTMPLKEMGKYSTRNIDGWEIRREDLPMTIKTYVWETPNFGDAATYGTHVHYHDREVYQREFHSPRFYQINTELLKAPISADGPNIYKFSIDHFLDRANPNFSDELLFMLNILQENVGSVDIFASSATREEYLGTIHVDWEVFPPGTAEELTAAITKGRGMSLKEEAIVKKRVELFSRLRPRAYLRGAGGLISYVGAQYADDLIVFENVRYGNALYILYSNWEEVSKRSRLEIIKGTDLKYDRIVHANLWEEAFKHILKREKFKRGIRD